MKALLDSKVVLVSGGTQGVGAAVIAPTIRTAIVRPNTPPIQCDPFGRKSTLGSFISFMLRSSKVCRSKQNEAIHAGTPRGLAKAGNNLEEYGRSRLTGP